MAEPNRRSTLEPRHLRPALDFALAVARAERRRRRDEAEVPGVLVPLLGRERIPAPALGRVARALEQPEAAAFRATVATAAERNGAVDEVGREWLTRADGWERRVAEVLERRRQAAVDEAEQSTQRREHHRREAAEEALRASRDELAVVGNRVAQLEADLAAVRAELASGGLELEALRAEVTAARRSERHAGDREQAARQRVEGLEAARDEALMRATQAERTRDELLAARAAAGGAWAGGSAGELTALRDLARSARLVADGLGSLVAPAALSRQPIAIPGNLVRSPVGAARHVLSTVGAIVLIDGYNVAKLGWPQRSLEEQRTALLDAVDALAKRITNEFVVVFDGADVVGAHSRRRRLARVVFSPAGVSADDAIRCEVSGADVRRPVVVVTNDREIRRDVTAAGANTIASNTLLELALG